MTRNIDRGDNHIKDVSPVFFMYNLWIWKKNIIARYVVENL